MLFLQNDRYLQLSAQLFDAKDMAAGSKAKKDKAGQRTAQDRIRVIQQGLCLQFSLLIRAFVNCKECKEVLLSIPFSVVFVYFTEMKSLECHPMFNSAIKVKDTPKEDKKPVTLTDGKEEINFNLFEEEDTPPAEKGRIIYLFRFMYIYLVCFFVVVTLYCCYFIVSYCILCLVHVVLFYAVMLFYVFVYGILCYFT